MKVKMTTALTTTTMVLSFGEVVELEDKFAKDLIDSNMATLVKEENKTPKKQEPLKEEETPVKRGRKKKVVK